MATMNLIETFSELLRRLMSQKGEGSVSHLAKGIGVTHTAVSQWLRNETLPRPAQVARLASLLGISRKGLVRACELSRLIGYAPSFETELRLIVKRRHALDKVGQSIAVMQNDVPPPLLHPRRLPTKYQRFRIDPHIQCCLMGPVYAVCDQSQLVEQGTLAVVLMNQRNIRFDRYDADLYKGKPAYRVTAIVPKK